MPSLKFDRLRIGSGLFAACAVLQLASPAAACELECLAPVQLPPGAELPGNMLYFKLRVGDPGELTLRTAEGEPVSAGIRTIERDRVFVPDAPIPAGTELVLEYTSSCGAPSSFEFVAAPHGALELRPGALLIEEEGAAHPGQIGEQSYVRVRYYSPDTNGLGEALMSHRFTVDGEPALLTRVGGVDLIEVAARCRPVAEEPLIDECGVVRTVAPGHHTVVATTTIVGQAVQPEPVALDVEVSCASDDDTESAGDESATASAALSASEASEATPSATSAQTASGCALPPGGRTRSGAAAAAVVALAALLRSRRAAVAKPEP